MLEGGVGEGHSGLVIVLGKFSFLDVHCLLGWSHTWSRTLPEVVAYWHLHHVGLHMVPAGLGYVGSGLPSAKLVIMLHLVAANILILRIWQA